MNPLLGFGLIVVGLAATFAFARLHIDGGTAASSVLTLGIAVVQTTSHMSERKKAAAPTPASSGGLPPPPPPSAPAA